MMSAMRERGEAMSLRKRFAGSVCTGLALALFPAVAGASTLQFDGTDRSPGAKEISSYSWGVSNNTASGLAITARATRNSPNFANAVATGKPVKRAQVYIGDEALGMALCMEDVTFTHYDVSGSEGEPGQETIRMQYQKLSQVVFARELLLTAVFDLKTGKFTVTTDNPCPTRG
jgi:type VI protein secretion system component Hcp